MPATERTYLHGEDWTPASEAWDRTGNGVPCFSRDHAESGPDAYLLDLNKAYRLRSDRIPDLEGTGTLTVTGVVYHEVEYARQLALPNITWAAQLPTNRGFVSGPDGAACATLTYTFDLGNPNGALELRSSEGLGYRLLILNTNVEFGPKPLSSNDTTINQTSPTLPADNSESPAATQAAATSPLRTSTIAAAVIVPVTLLLLALAALFFWRRWRRQPAAPSPDAAFVTFPADGRDSPVESEKKAVSLSRVPSSAM